MYPLALHQGQQKTRWIFWGSALAVMAALSWGGWYYAWHRWHRGQEFYGIIAEAAQRNGIDSLLLQAVIRQESGFDPEARGGAGEVGLMQVIPGPKGAAQDWANAHGVALPCRGVLQIPAVNVEVGAWYLARALRRWSDYQAAVELALCEYNAGLLITRSWKPTTFEGGVMDRISYRSTRGYVAAIVANYHELVKNRERKKHDQ